MSLIELSNPYLTAFATGLVYGSLVCTATCLPYIASYIAGTGANFRRGIFATLTFNSGRIIAYTLIGALVSVFSGLVQFIIEESTCSIIQAYSTIAFSIVTMILGIFLLYKNQRPVCDCNKTVFNAKPRLIRRFDVGAFTLGLSRGAVLCWPLIVLLLYTIPFAGPIDSIVLAALFGIGTALSPMLLIGGVTGWLLNKATLLQKYIALVGAIIIIILGISTLISSLQILI
ncbi:MAG: sulfite exporter TauE/SafE family protein [Candidatus Bathyarchaeota archaeon]|nr:sulfite exporter TauE/SafE family protein [Candidatus Termiticorpusculum sp.]